MAMDHAKVASEVLDALGGAGNINAAAHCATRLRLVINDDGKINQKALDDNPALKGTFKAGGMFQIIVGPGDVDVVYDHLVKDGGVREVSKDEAKSEAEAGGNIFSRFIKTIADIFVPVLPALIAGGLLMALNNILSAKGLIYEGEGITDHFKGLKDYAALINMLSAAPFAFLPVLIGFSAVKRFGGNVYLGAAMGAAMISTSLTSAYDLSQARIDGKVQYWHMFGLNVEQAGYQAMVIPVLVVAWILAWTEKQFHKILKGTADFLLTPLLTILIVGFLTFIVVGPITREISDGLTEGIVWVYEHAGPVGGFVFGLFYSPIVVTGLHQSFPAVEIPLISGAKPAGDFIFPIASMANVAQGAAALAVFFTTRDQKMKGMSGASAASALFGITEPAIFGVNLRLRWPFFIAMGASAIGGTLVALFDVRSQALGAAGFVGFVSIRTNDIAMYVAIEAITFLVGFIAAFFYGKTRGNQGAGETVDEAPAVAIPEEAATDFSIVSPLKGEVVPLNQVKDATFAKGILGDGVAIAPAGGVVVSPIDGEVKVAFPTGHAYGLASASGVEILIHIGMDTVELNGEGFKPLVKTGDKVRKGQPLVEVDWELLKSKGYEIVTPVVVSNGAKFAGVNDKSSGKIATGDPLYTVAPAAAPVA